MNYDENLYAEVVFDGVETYAPERMGQPKAGQLQGATHERLVELCGRVCYDSLGKGRSSAEYHEHIRKVNHGSVWEHANITIQCTDTQGRDLGREMFPILLNRPGVWVEHHEPSIVRVTINMRGIVEWDRWAGGHNLGSHRGLEAAIRAIVFTAGHVVAPQIVDDPGEIPDQGVNGMIVTPEHPEEKWVSLLLGGSRGMSHEQVRHKFRTAISQRSTRYVDESTSPWVVHPLVTRYIDETTDDKREFLGDIEKVGTAARNAYVTVAGDLQPWLEARGIDKHTSRKQARGAARGFLGNALHTELIFSASVVQWRRMIALRCSPHADAEIRVLYGHIIRALQTTRWADDFADLKLVPSPDGIGEVAEI